MSRIFLLSIITIFVLLYIIFQNWYVSVIFWFIIVGLTVGLYYGWFNNDIFHKSGEFNNEFEKIQALWIHIVCGLSSSIGLFILSKNFSTSSKFDLGDFALLIFVILGITGLLPRTLWFLANRGNLKP